MSLDIYFNPPPPGTVVFVRFSLPFIRIALFALETRWNALETHVCGCIMRMMFNVY